MVTLISQEGGIVVFQGGGQVLTIDTNTCIMCTLCESVCPQSAMYFEDGYVGDGIYESLVYVGMRFKANDCDLTGACVSVCPPGSLTITNAIAGPPDTFGPGEAPLPIREIYNNLTHPCLVSAFAQINNSGSLNTDIGWMLHSVFNDWDEAEIWIGESTTMANNLNGTTRPYHYGNIFKAEVFLNVNTLPNASMEFISGTIYHEIIHAYLQHSGQLDNLNNHISMTLDYIESLKSTLQHYYPALSSTAAEALAWVGLDETDAWNTLDATKKSQLTSLQSSHRYGTSGTPCNP